MALNQGFNRRTSLRFFLTMVIIILSTLFGASSIGCQTSTPTPPSSPVPPPPTSYLLPAEDGMWILPATHTRQHEEYSARICRTFGEEVLRLMRNGGNVVIPGVIIQSPTSHVKTFTDVAVTAHNFRSDVLQPGTVTALDILLSLGEQGKLTRLKLTWHERIGGVDPVDSYWVEQIKHTSSQNCDYHPCCISAILANPEGSCV